MSAAEIIAIIQLATVLEPQVITLVNNIVTAFNSGDQTPEERQKMLEDLTATLKPMTPKTGGPEEEHA